MAAGVKVNRLAKSAPPAQLPATVLHLYGLTQSPGPSAELFRDLKGVDGAASVEPLACAGLICWISRVSEADFARDLAKNMQDLDWLAAATTRHQQVVSAIAQAADILPARFGIEFLNEKSLGSHIENREAVLKADFNRIRGKEEWGVKVFVLPIVPVPKKTIRTGKEYLQAKSALTRRAADRASPELEFHKTLLLKRADRKRLESLVRSYSRKWKNKRRVECTGPWPPFSFVSQPDSSG